MQSFLQCVYQEPTPCFDKLKITDMVVMVHGFYKLERLAIFAEPLSIGL